MRQSKRLAGVEADDVHIKDDYDRATHSDFDGGLEDILAGQSDPGQRGQRYDRWCDSNYFECSKLISDLQLSIPCH